MSETLYGAAFQIWIPIDEMGFLSARVLWTEKQAKRWRKMFPGTRVVEAECRMILNRNFKRKRRK